MNKNIFYTILKSLTFGVIIMTISCDDEDTNHVDGKTQFFVTIPESASNAEVFEDATEDVFVPISIGNTLTQSAAVTLSIFSESGAVYGVDYTTVPDGSSGSMTIDVPVGSTDIKVQIVPIVTDAMVNNVVTFNIESVNGGLILSEESVPYNLLISDQSLNVTILAYTSFEEPRAGDINNYATQEGIEQENVVDIDGNVLNSVDYVSIGGEMGFDMSYVPGDEAGEDTSLYFGVTNVVNEPGDWNVRFFKDGAQAYVTSDADGLAEIVFDEVTGIPANTEFLKVRLSTFFVDASWETSDEFDVFWRTVDGDELLLSFRSNGDLMTDAPDGSGNIIIDSWFTFDAFVSNIKDGRLVIQIGTNSGSEIAFIDAIEIGIK